MQLNKSRLAGIFDPFLTALLTILVAGIFIPLPGVIISFLHTMALFLVMLLFFLYGGRTPTFEVVAGLKNWRLQLGVFIATFIVFPLIGILTAHLNQYLVGNLLALGLFYLTLLPSTVQSSVAFTSMAGGNVAGAICSATISNVLGVVLTPFLVAIFIGKGNGFNPQTLIDICVHLLLPFFIGQIMQPWIGGWLRNHRSITKATDQSTVLFVVAAAVASATAKHLWSTISLANIFILMAICAITLALMLVITWYSGALLKLCREDRIVLLMCGSKKSLATGLPMAAIIFPATLLGPLSLPVIIFHQMQLLVCATIARKMGNN